MNLHTRILHLLSKLEPKQVNTDATDQIKKTIKVYTSHMKDKQTDEHDQDEER